MFHEIPLEPRGISVVMSRHSEVSKLVAFHVSWALLASREESQKESTVILPGPSCVSYSFALEFFFIRIVSVPVLVVSEIKSISHKGDYEIKNTARKEHIDPHWKDDRHKNIQLLVSLNKTNLGDNSTF